MIEICRFNDNEPEGSQRPKVHGPRLAAEGDQIVLLERFFTFLTMVMKIR